MGLAEYFEKTEGMGVLATSDAKGNVELAIYARPYVIDEETIGFSMAERLSLLNLESNPKAAYMFVEKGQGYRGKRLYLVKLGEETDSERVEEIKKQHRRKSHVSKDAAKHFVYFKINRIRPLAGNGR